MNEKDVIKTLGHCTREFCYHGCPYYGENRCVSKLNADALALLREKDALLEEWDAKLKSYETELLGKDADIERLQAQNAIYERGVEMIAVSYHKIGRAEAITEFAERIKATFPAKNDARCTLDDCYTLDKIDEIAKEMEGEDGLP